MQRQTLGKQMEEGFNRARARSEASGLPRVAVAFSGLWSLRAALSSVRRAIVVLHNSPAKSAARQSQQNAGERISSPITASCTAR